MYEIFISFLFVIKYFCKDMSLCNFFNLLIVFVEDFIVSRQLLSSIDKLNDKVASIRLIFHCSSLFKPIVIFRKLNPISCRGSRSGSSSLMLVISCVGCRTSWFSFCELILPLDSNLF